MNFEFTEEQLMIKQAAKDFARTELLKGVIERDNNAIFPAEQIKKLGELGFLGMMTDPEYDGGGMDTDRQDLGDPIWSKCTDRRYARGSPVEPGGRHSIGGAMESVGIHDPFHEAAGAHPGPG